MPDISNPISVAALICTKNRPKGLKALVQSLNAMRIPDNINFQVCVSDNNSVSQVNGYIKDAFSNAAFSYVVEHEPVPGYSSARNRTLKLALETDAEYFLVTDDDLVVDVEWLAEHIMAFDTYRSDINCGVQSGGRNSRTEGQVIKNVYKRVGTSNLAFKRSVIDSNGLNVRFDMKFNEIGGEDSGFVHDAQLLGAKIIFASKALVHMNEPDWNKDPRDAFKSAWNLAEIRRVKHNNVVVQLIKGKRWFKLAKQLLKTIPDTLSWALLAIGGWLLTPFNVVSGLKLRARAYKNLCKIRGTISGLRGKTLSRSHARRDDISTT